MSDESENSSLGTSSVRSYVAVFGLLAAYFFLWLLPHALPSAAGSPFFFLYVLSIPVVLLVLLGLLVSSCISLAIARARGLPGRRSYRLVVVISTLGLLAFFAAVSLGRVLPRPLPSGSYRAEFDASAWQAEDAAAFNRDDITARQQMLGSLLDRLEPSLSRSEIEAMLGPPHPPGFPYGSEGSDLHYMTGPQRDALFGLDSEWLLIYLDDAGHFSRYEIYVD
jgi:hypothetical protein